MFACVCVCDTHVDGRSSSTEEREEREKERQGRGESGRLAEGVLVVVVVGKSVLRGVPEPVSHCLPNNKRGCTADAREEEG